MQRIQWEEQAKDEDNVKDGGRGHDRNEKQAGTEQVHGGSQGPQRTVALHIEIKKKKKKKIK
jgi:hypothetical protein